MHFKGRANIVSVEHFQLVESQPETDGGRLCDQCAGAGSADGGPAPSRAAVGGQGEGYAYFVSVYCC